MMLKKLILPAAAVLAVAACGQAANGQSQTPSEVRNDAVQQDFDAPSGTYAPDPHHRYITFSYTHQGYSHPWLRWREWDGTLNWNAEDPSKSSVNVTINADSIDSGVNVFDGHLKGENFFDTARYPEIKFASTGIEQTGPTTGTMTGDLTIKGVTKPVTLYVTFNKGAYEERGKIYKLGFSAKGTVKRSDFGVDAYVPIVSDDVNVVIESEFTMAAGDKK